MEDSNSNPSSILHPPSSFAVLLAVGALGVSCVMTQLALLRELLGAFSGNELVLGVVLGNWLLLMGVGAWLGCGADKFQKPFAVLIALQIWVAVVPLAQVFLLRALRNVIFIRGAEVGPAETVVSAFVLLLPYCVSAGGALTLACSLLARQAGAAGVGQVYVLDSLGGIAGGALFSFVLVRWLDHAAILIYPAVLNLVIAGLLGFNFGHKWLAAIAGFLVIAVISLAAAVDLDGISTALQYPRQHIVARANSPYGKLLVTESDGQFDFIENGVPLTSTRDDQHVEETVHFAMAQRPEARTVLLVGGGISGTAREILKYKVRRVDYAELDPAILDFGRKYLPQNLADNRIRIINADGRQFIRQTGEKYDVVILDLPEPSTAQLNRFFTVEFFAEVKRALAPGGVVSFALGHYENYVSPELARMLASATQSLRPSFQHILVIPGGRVFVDASDGSLFTNIASRIEQQGIATKLMNRHYLDAMLTPDRWADMQRALAQPAALNTDFSPVLYFYHLRHWTSQFQIGFGAMQVLLLVLLGFYLVRLRGAALVLFASGVAGTALEMVLLLAFQVLCGSVYQQVCVIVTVFMAGLALGAMMANRSSRRKENQSLKKKRHEANELAPAQFKIGRVTPCAPGQVASQDGAHGVTRPTFAVRWQALTGKSKVDQSLLTSAATNCEDRSRGRLAVLAFAVASYAILLAFFLPLLNRAGDTVASLWFIKAVIALLTLVLAVLVGMQFPLANRLEFDGSVMGASRLYTADFVGAFLGALLASTLLFPLIGVAGVCVLTAALNLFAGITFQFRKA